MPNENNQNNEAARQPTALQRFKAAFFTVAGVAAILVCLVIAFYTWRFTSAAATAPGAVTRLNAGGSHVQVQFTTAAGDTIEYPQNGMISGYQVGDRVEVLYDPREPRTTAVISTFGAIWGFLLSGFLMGAVFIGIAQLGRRRPDLIG